MSTIKAVGITSFGPIENLKMVDIPRPTPSERDLIVRVKAVALNPVDCKNRSGTFKLGDFEGIKVLGWDASGIVEEIGSGVQFYKPGDEVYFAGSIVRQGCNAELVAVDERITGKKPVSLSFEESACIGLTGLTAWEGLTECLGIQVPHSDKDKELNGSKSILVIGGAGGVGSIVVQIAKRVLGLKVIATASRPETVEWAKKMGADEVINHSKGLTEEFKRIGLSGVDYIYNTSDTDPIFDQFASLINPFGKIVCIVGTQKQHNIGALSVKSAGLIWELMFTKSIFGYNLESQKRILDTLADLFDKKILQTTLTRSFKSFAEIHDAHREQESGKIIGKLAISAVFS